MNYFNKLYLFLLLIFAAVGLSSCQQNDSSKLSIDQKKILDLYASEHLNGEYEHLYNKSVKKKDLRETLSPPLSYDDFRLPDVALFPGKKQRFDTLFTKQELASWSSEINDYKRITWPRKIFPKQVKFMKQSEIPDYLSRTDIPPPDQDPTFIHYLTVPFIYEKAETKTALLYAKRWSSGANIDVRYYYFKKKESKWILIRDGALNVGY